MFTQGQADRMNASLNLYRSSLITSTDCNIFSGIKNNNQPTALSVYPNPASEKLNLSSPALLSFTILNILGEEMRYSKTVGEKNNMSIDVSGFPNGIYLLSGNDIGKVKFVVQH
jgi:hypothetical protein